MRLLDDFALPVWQGKFSLSDWWRLSCYVGGGRVLAEKCLSTPPDTCLPVWDDMGDNIDNIKRNNCVSSSPPTLRPPRRIKSMCHSMWFIAENNGGGVGGVYLCGCVFLCVLVFGLSFCCLYSMLPHKVIARRMIWKVDVRWARMRAWLYLTIPIAIFQRRHY